MIRPYTAHIAADSPRRALWLEAFGDDVVPIVSPMTHRASAPGVGSTDFYLVDARELTDDQLARLAAVMAREFAIDPHDVERDLAIIGAVPILARDVTVAVDLRMVL